MKTMTKLKKSWLKSDFWLLNYSVLCLKLKRPRRQRHLLLERKTNLRDERKFTLPSWSVFSLVEFLAGTGVHFRFIFERFFHQILDLIGGQTSPLDMLGFLLMHTQNVLFGSKTFTTYSTISQSRIAWNEKK